jgi:hypothetical protein
MSCWRYVSLTLKTQATFWRRFLPGAAPNHAASTSCRICISFTIRRFYVSRWWRQMAANEQRLVAAQLQVLGNSS